MHLKLIISQDYFLVWLYVTKFSSILIQVGLQDKLWRSRSQARLRKEDGWTMSKHPIPVKKNYPLQKPGTDLQNNMVQGLMDHQGSRTDFRESQKDAIGPKPSLLWPKQITRIACWNVRTLYLTGKTLQLTREMDRYNIYIYGVSECRWNRSGKIILTTGETVVFSWCEIEHQRGVPLVMAR